MIDQAIFKREWVILCERWNRTPSPEMTARYFQAINGRMTTESFLGACRVLFARNEFFPSPDEFVDAVNIPNEAKAIDQWELCLRVAEGEHHVLNRMDQVGKRVVAALGGPDALGRTDRDRVSFLRGEFLRTYIDLTHSREYHQIEGPEVTPESRRIMGEILNQRGTE